MRTCGRAGLLCALAGLVLSGGGQANAWPGATQRVSVASNGDQADGSSEYSAISSDGRYMAFHSSASNLVTGDSNGVQDVFDHDRQTGVTERLSVATDGAQGSRGSLHPAISQDGRFVAFDSWAPDLVAEDTNDRVDVFVRDRQTNNTERVSLSGSGVEGNDTSWYPAISADGRFVAFQSFASNLVSGDSNNVEDVFVRDRQTSTTVRISLSSGGVQGNNGSWDAAISSDGRFVAFGSDASNLVTGDTNGVGDIFVRDRDTDADGIFDEAEWVSTTRVSVRSGGTQSNGDSYYAAINADGHYVAFGSAASNLVTGDTNGYSDVFVRDRQEGTTTRVSVDSSGVQGNNASVTSAISADGQYVAFDSYATNLVPYDTNGAEDAFVRDAGTTTRVSVDSSGFQGNGASAAPAISGDGRFTAFESVASNLVPWDSNGASDIFLHDQVASPVGGVAELPDVSGTPGQDYILPAGLAAAALGLLVVGGRHAGRRRSR